MTLATTEKPNVTDHVLGACWWVDINVSDTETAREFYGDLFGWTFENVMDEGEYWMARRGGCRVAALTPLKAEQATQGVPPHVFSYFSVADADASAKQVVELGGTLIAGPFDVFDSGRMAVVSDPQGGHFALWQAIKHPGAELVNAPGAISWNQLMTTDIEGAKTFYGSLLGWTFAAEGDSYYIWSIDGKQRGGAMQLTPEMGPVPTNWNTLFAIDDVDGALEKVTAAGGKVIMPAEDTPYGRMAQISDPQGVMLGLIQMTSEG